MKNKIFLTDNSYLWHFNSGKQHAEALLIIPNTAGYFAKSPKYDRADYRIDKFCYDLAVKYEVYYLVLPGQDPSIKDAKYGYTGSIEVATSAIRLLIRQERCVIAGVIGMCTGAVIAVEALNKSPFSNLPLVLYNTAARVGWNNPLIQKIFLRKYGNVVNLDCEELKKNAPAELTPIIEKHNGKILQIASGNSDYRLELQHQIKISGMITETFMTMSDAPIGESPEYLLMLDKIFKFF